MSFKDRKRDDHGHVIGNDEVDGQECKHVNGGSVKQDVFDDDYDEEFDAADEEYNREMKKAQEENAEKSIKAEEFDKDEFDEEPKDNLMDPKNPKYEGFKRSDITNAKVVDEGKKIHNYDKDEDETLSIIEYIPYGALQDGDNRKLYGVVKNYDGSDTPKTGVIVSPDLKSAQEDLKSQIELAEQGSERYLKRGKWDEEFFNIMNDKEYEFDDDTKKKYSEKYGWDFSKPWNEQEHVKKNKTSQPMNVPVNKVSMSALPKHHFNNKGHLVIDEGEYKGEYTNEREFWNDVNASNPQVVYKDWDKMTSDEQKITKIQAKNVFDYLNDKYYNENIKTKPSKQHIDLLKKFLNNEKLNNDEFEQVIGILERNVK